MTAKKTWYSKQTPRIKMVTTVCGLIIALGGTFGVLEAFGVRIFRVAVSVGSVPEIEARVTTLEARTDKDSVVTFWKGIRRLKDSTETGIRLDKIEKKIFH